MARGTLVGLAAVIAKSAAALCAALAMTLQSASASTSTRTVILIRAAAVAPGGDVVRLIAGPMPNRATVARVLTDTNCAPDMQGVSHCTNVLRLADGRTITVRHDHVMMMIPCLAPEEMIRLVPRA